MNSTLPIIKKGTRHPPIPATNATKGTPITDESEVKAISSPNALARLSAGSTAATAAMLFGGIIPPASPVMIRNPISTPKVGAKLEAMTLAASKVNPMTATGRRPNESDIGPTETTDTAQAANVTAANCPAAATETLNSSDRATKIGESISPTICVDAIPMPVMAKNRACFNSELVANSGN